MSANTHGKMPSCLFTSWKWRVTRQLPSDVGSTASQLLWIIPILNWIWINVIHSPDCSFAMKVMAYSSVIPSLMINWSWAMLRLWHQAAQSSIKIEQKWLAKVFTKRAIKWSFVITHLVHTVAYVGISHAELQQKGQSEFNTSSVHFVFKEIVSEK